MILRRLGNKKKIAKDIQQYFPPHKIYIEPFFGAGGMFFNKPKAKYNIVNDLDSDVFNLFQVVMNQKDELEKAFYMMPIHSDLLDYWKQNEETEPIILSPDKKEEISIGTVAKIIGEQMGFKGKIKFDTTKADGQYKKTASNIKLRKYLPQFKFTSIDQALQNTIQWFVNAYPDVRK